MAKKAVVIGGGAAGFFCAVNAARKNPGLEIILLEKSKKLLSKVKVSGGGRCNVTHACFDIAAMSAQYPRGANFVKKAFHQYFTTDTIQWFEERGVKLKTETDGRMFPVTNQSQTIIDCLLKEAAKFRVQIRMGSEVVSVRTEAGNNFIIELKDGEKIAADYTCIASGGYPKPEMYNWLKALGHSVEEPVPSLFTFNIPGHRLTGLQGISVQNAAIKIMDSRLSESGPLLITHWGLSGPAVLRLSAWGAGELAQKKYDFKIRINWLGGAGYHETALRDFLEQQRKGNAASKISTDHFTGLPQRLWQYLLSASGVDAQVRYGDLSTKTAHQLVQNLTAFELHVKGKTGFKEEFVTAGGIRLSEVDPNRMMSKKIKGLFFAGEILDVDGITGGFNFQHAWTSGYIAGKFMAALP